MARDTQPMPIVRFTAVLIRLSSGSGAWTFVEVPAHLAPAPQHPWGRTPVTATVDGRCWRTSVWRERSGRTLLPVPRAVRGARGPGTMVHVELEFAL